MFIRACSILGIEPYEAVMIGDNPETDIKGANKLGMKTILIGGNKGSTLDFKRPNKLLKGL